MSAIPWVGQDIVEFIWGGFSVNNATLNRFYALHFVLPFVLAALALMHLIALHDSAGSGNPLGVSGNYDRLPFAPYFIFKDLITIFIFIIVLSVFVFFMPNILGDSENYVMANPMQTPPAIVPEWYLLPFYAILRSIPNKLLGVIAMFSAILILLAMPFADLSKSRGFQFRPLSKIAFFIFVGNFLILMQLGAKHVESVRRCAEFVMNHLDSSIDSIILITLGLAITENVMLNKASPIKNAILILAINYQDRIWVILSMVKAILLKAHYSLSYNVGSFLDCIGNLVWNLRWGIAKIYESKTTSELVKFIKSKNVPPKDSGLVKTHPWTNFGTSGLPKGWKTYGNRDRVVDLINRKGSLNRRLSVGSLFDLRPYSIGRGETNSMVDKLNDLYFHSSDNLSIDRKLYKMINKDLLLLAYSNIKSKPGNLTPSLNPQTLDGVSDKFFDQLVTSLISGRFSFQASRQVNISKPTGGERTLRIAPPRDKIVQEAIRLILNAVFEPIFLNTSHGFRPNRSCHTALEDISIRWTGLTWAIEGDIYKCFDTIDHGLLMIIIEEKIQDREFTKLIRKSLKAGYFEFTTYKANAIGTPQGSIISPILANIFMHQLDLYVESLAKEFNKGYRSSTSKNSRSFEYQISKYRKAGDFTKVKELIKLRNSSSSINTHDPDFKKLDYVRYADDWVIGVKGSFDDAKLILSKVKCKLLEMKLNLNTDKTKITNLYNERVLFLGVEIFYSKVNTIREYWNNNILFSQRKVSNIRMEAPLTRVIKRLTEAKFIAKGKAAPRFLWLHHTHGQILHLYNSVVRGYLNYYSFVHNYNSLVQVMQTIVKSSCAKLLAAKFSLNTRAKVYSKFGSLMEFADNKGNKHCFIPPKYGVTRKFKTSRIPKVDVTVTQTNIDNLPMIPLYTQKSVSTFESLICRNCNSDYRVEMHHIRALKDLNPKISGIDKLMIKARRKQIPLCRDCHMNYHNKKI